MMQKAWSLKVDSESFAELSLDVPGKSVNVLSTDVMMELDEVLTQLNERHDVRAVMITSAKENIFIAGADISEIQGLRNRTDAVEKAGAGQRILQKLSQLSIPTLAVIDGACLGGGLELALACDWRIVSTHDKTKLGLPEVKLGLLPGFGGTQRLPRLVGYAQALTMILTGKELSGERALKCALADACVPQAFLLQEARKILREAASPEGAKLLAKARKKLQKRSRYSFKETMPLGRQLIFKVSRKNIAKQAGSHYPAPSKALSVVQSTAGKSIEKGLEVEREAFGDLAMGEVSRNLVHLFFLDQDIRNRSWDVDIKAAKDIEQAAVLGAGIMGGGIAALLAGRGIPVRMRDISWEALAQGFKTAAESFAVRVKRRRISEREAGLAMNRLSGETGYDGFGHCDFIIEAIVENIDIKRTVFRELEKDVSTHAVIATNTSSLRVNAMSEALKHPDRFVGMHFFNPVYRMPLVEVIPGERTSDQTVAITVKLARRLGKLPVVVQDCAGFLVNRILGPYMMEAGWLLQEGADIERVDRIMKEFGLPMGPFRLMDEVGIDTGVKVSAELERAYGRRMRQVPLVTAIYEELKLTGKKSERGFYLYLDKAELPNTDVSPRFSQKFMKKHDLRPTDDLSDDDIRDRLLLIMVNEAARCLTEKVVRDAACIDLAMIMGTGFPPFRGGLLKYADDRGIDHIFSRLKELTLKVDDRFKPAPMLVDMAVSKRRFYDVSSSSQSDNSSALDEAVDKHDAESSE
jgi:3-hydroxyacyl-CoA dehydrogenase/enoyl-CoA hydratase/3-hydroxybutyryl-CoA epimerase